MLIQRCRAKLSWLDKGLAKETEEQQGSAWADVAMLAMTRKQRWFAAETIVYLEA